MSTYPQSKRPLEDGKLTARRQTLHARRICEVCSTPENPISVRASQWSAHLKSKRHRREKRYGDLGREGWIEAQKELGKARARRLT